VRQVHHCQAEDDGQEYGDVFEGAHGRILNRGGGPFVCGPTTWWRLPPQFGVPDFLLRHCSSRETKPREERETPFTDILDAAPKRKEPGGFLRITVSVET
jgi:hypothetical protein